MTDGLKELRVAARALVKRPGFAAAAAITLALGIGANVAIFTVVNAVLLRPLPFPDADRIVTILHHAPGINLPELQSSPGLITHYREGSRTLTRAAGFEFRERNLTGGGTPERVRVIAVTPELFEVLAIRPARGRHFYDSDAQPGSAAVAILTNALWQSRFGGDPAIVGRQVELDGVATEIVGVMPAAFAYPDRETRLLIPLWLDPARGFGSFGTRTLARLSPGVTLEAARREIDDLQRRIPERFPDMTPDLFKQFGWSVTVDPLRDVVVRTVSAPLWIVFGAVGLLLLIAGANVANLFLVRGESRQREVAIRATLGASWSRIATTFMAESALLALAGGVGGLALAAAGVQLLVAYGPPQLPRLHEISVDWRVVGFAAALTAVTGSILGALPVWHLARRSFTLLLRDSGRGNTAGRGRMRVRQLLIAGQVALALVLLVGAALMLQSLARLSAVDPGFKVDGILTTGVSLGGATDRARMAVFYQQVLDTVAALPGVTSAGAGTSLPIAATRMNGSSFDIQSRPRTDDQIKPVTMFHAVMPGYFETLGIRLIDGRLPERADADPARHVAWVNETFARSFLDGRAVGERIRISDHPTWLEIVGVVGDVRTFGLREEIRPMTYLPLGTPVPNVDLGTMQIVVATTGTPASLAPLLRPAVDRVDRSVPLTATRTMTEIVSSSLAQMSLTITLVTLAALIALALGAVGLYAVISYVVSQRTAEIGVRMALGARPSDVRRLVLWQGLSVVVAGLIAGLAAAAAASQLLGSLLFEVSARDPVTFAAVAALLLAVSAAAIYPQVQRAVAVDPVRAIREEV